MGHFSILRTIIGVGEYAKSPDSWGVGFYVQGELNYTKLYVR
jgi:hypothetical protein